MSNIYNKKILFPNGTLIDNWFEEDELRKYTGEGRTIPGKHFPKKNFDFSQVLKNTNPKDNTFKRVIGEKEPQNSYFTYNKSYGTYERPEEKYFHPQLRQAETDAKFKLFVQTTQNLQEEITNKNDSLRMNNSTYRSVHVPQPFLETLGKRHMFTQDMDKIPDDNPDKLFMAQHKMSKFPEALTKEQGETYVDRFVPYYKDREMTFWAMNLGKSNMYKTFQLGINPFGKSHCFTQPIQKTRGTTQYYGNTQNLISSKNIYLDEHDAEFYEKYKSEVEKAEFKIDISCDIKKTLLGNCAKRGWIGLRYLKIYLKSVAKNRGEILDKSDFQFFTTKAGVTFSEYEIGFIFNRFDKKKCNKINYIEVLNSFRDVSDNRKVEILRFKEQLLGPEQRFISFSKLERIYDMNHHPEVMAFVKTAPDVEREYLNSWEGLKEDDLITQDAFQEFFFDISSCVEKDEDFVQCLISCGYKN